MRNILFIIGFCVMFEGLFAQQFQQHSLWYYQSSISNPAFSGWGNGLSITMDKRMQWMGWEGAPRTNFIGMDMPLFFGKLGIGANLIGDKVGVRSFQTSSLNAAYHLKLGKKWGELSFGLSGGLNTVSADFSSLLIQETSDLNAYNLEKSKKWLVGFGSVWHTKNFYLGVSVPTLRNIEFANDSARISLQRHYYLQSGYLRKCSALWKWKTNVNLKFTPQAPLSVDLNSLFIFDDKVGLGLSARWKESIGIPVMINITDFFTLAYSYEFPVNGMFNQQRGSQEILINFNIHGRPKAVASPRFF